MNHEGHEEIEGHEDMKLFFFAIFDGLRELRG